MTGSETEQESHELARRIARHMLERAATDVLVLDLRGLSSACDFFVICTGSSEPQVRAITEHLETTLKADGSGPWHVEGKAQRRWVLLDFVHVVAHVFHKEAREYYLLERLWSDAPREEFERDEDSSSVHASAGRGGAQNETEEWDTEGGPEGENG